MTASKAQGLATIHLNAFINSLERYKATRDKADIFKIIYHGVHAANMLDKYADPNARLELFEHVNAMIALLTPQELMRIFPVDKKYDGEKWQCKDYFSTMEAMREHGLDKPIGDGVYNFLWDYMNRALITYSVKYMSAMSDIYKAQTGKGILEKFCEDKGIAMYHKFTADNGREYMRDTATGKFIRIKQPLPDGWKIIISRSKK